jgi:hypothetical protein
VQGMSQRRSFANVCRSIYRNNSSVIRRMMILVIGKRDDSLGMRGDGRDSIE